MPGSALPRQQRAVAQAMAGAFASNDFRNAETTRCFGPGPSDKRRIKGARVRFFDFLKPEINPAPGPFVPRGAHDGAYRGTMIRNH
jgi:hypothetical protein